MISPLSGLRLFKTVFIVWAISISITFFPGKPVAKIKNPFEPAIPFSSVSNRNSVWGLVRNPVFADDPGAPSIGYRPFSAEPGTEWNHSVMLGIAGFSFNYTYFNSLYDPNTGDLANTKISLLTVNKGFMFNNFFGVGFGYGCSSGRRPYDGYSSFSLGLLMRASRFLSLGYSVWDLNSPELNKEELYRREVFSVSLRPFHEFITVSCDAVRYGGKDLSWRDVYFTGDCVFWKDISLFASVDLRSNIYFGLSLPLSPGGKSGSTMILDYTGSLYNGRESGLISPGILIRGEKYRSPMVLERSWLKIVLRGEIRENEERPLFKKPKACFYSILEGIQKAGSDDSIAGILLIVDNTNLGFSQIQELREQFKLFRRAGKKIYAHIVSPGNRGYYLATAADRIYMSPNTTFNISGLVAEVYFFKTLLDTIGVRYESVRKGKYKSFSEPFTRKGMSDEHRRNLTSVLTDLNEQYLKDIAADRNIPRKRIDDLFSRGFILPEEAVKLKFIDEVKYHGDLEEHIQGNRSGYARSVDIEDYIGYRQKVYQWGPQPVIAVIHVDGVIVRGMSARGGLLMRDATGDELYRGALEHAFLHPQIKAVIVRIDSGGGSSIASDFMWHYLVMMKKKYNKPVIFSFGNIAASGGYYIACTGDKIFSNRATVTGSIGVVAGKISLETLYKKLGISRDVISLSEFADIFTESRDLSERERKLLQKGVDFTYRLFIKRVRESRKIEKKDIEKTAQGKIFTGLQALDGRLVDKIGGLMAAVEYAKKMVNVKGEFGVVHLPVKRTGLFSLFDTNGASSLNQVFRGIVHDTTNMGVGDERIFLIYPFAVVIK